MCVLHCALGMPSSYRLDDHHMFSISLYSTYLLTLLYLLYSTYFTLLYCALGMPSSYRLDDHHLFETNKLALVCGNTAAMLGEDAKSWLARHFEIIGLLSISHVSYS